MDDVDLTLFLRSRPARARSVRIEIMPPVRDPGPQVFNSVQINEECSVINFEPLTNLSPQVVSSELDIRPDQESPKVSSSEVKKLELGSNSAKLKRKAEEIEKSSDDSLIPTGPGYDDKNGKTDSDEISGAETREPKININMSVHDQRTEEPDFKNQGIYNVEETEAPTAPTSLKRFACSSCGKTFLSHKALGGHRSSSHNKSKKIEIYDAVDYEHKMKSATRCDRRGGDSTATKNASRGEKGASPESVDDGRTHTCTICSKTFSSGQALGGHQRSHWTARTGNVPDENSKTACRVLDFDLNELPKEEDEDAPPAPGSSSSPR